MSLHPGMRFVDKKGRMGTLLAIEGNEVKISYGYKSVYQNKSDLEEKIQRWIL